MDGNLQKYQAFVKTIEHGSFTRAAEVLGYSQSAISKMIADLEKEWNVTLLERTRSGVQLTADGIALLPYANALCDDFRKLQNQVDELNNIQSGIIRIGVLSSVTINWMPNIIHAFHKDYPNVEFEILLGDYSEIDRWIAEGRVECGFLRLPISSDFDIIELEEDELKVILPKGHPLAGKKTIDICDLVDEPFIMLEDSGKTEVEEFLEQYHIQPKKRITAREDYTIMSMVEGGLGIAVLPGLILKRIPFELEIRDLSETVLRKIVFATRSRKITSMAVRRFVEYLQYR